MDLTTVTSAYNGLKFAKDVFTGLMQLKIETDSLSKINDAVRKVGDAQDAIFQLREELFKLQEEKNELKKKLSEFELWENKISQYELAKTSGNAVVYRYKGEPEHFICPSCVTKHVIEILQDNRTMSGKFRCIGCKGEYPVNPSEKPTGSAGVSYT